MAFLEIWLTPWELHLRSINSVGGALPLDRRVGQRASKNVRNWWYCLIIQIGFGNNSPEFIEAFIQLDEPFINLDWWRVMIKLFVIQGPDRLALINLHLVWVVSELARRPDNHNKMGFANTKGSNSGHAMTHGLI